MKALTLGRLARMTGMARSSLLHYEQLGLLTAQVRSAAGYRLYGDAEIEQLRAIRLYRDAGLSLTAIRQLLGGQSQGRSGATANLLEARLLALTGEIQVLRSQQRLLARLLASREFRKVGRCRSKAAWTAMLRRAGFSDDEMREWHAGFEAESPAEHATFLRSLGLSRSEVTSIRRWARKEARTRGANHDSRD